jgi:hypothetical protein
VCTSTASGKGHAGLQHAGTAAGQAAQTRGAGVTLLAVDTGITV